MRRALKLGAISLALALTGLTILLAFAKVEITQAGAHKRLLVPVGKGAAGFQLYSATGEHFRAPNFLDGPVVRRHGKNRWSATWFCEDRVHHAEGSGSKLAVTCAGGLPKHFDLESAPLPDSTASMPDKVVVLSDLEGNVEFLNDSLNKLGVTGAGDDWAFGQNHLVILGDSVDRGRDVFAVLWRLHALAQQAQRAGGAVHVLLGNHEQYILRGNFSRTHPDHRYAVREMGGFPRTFAPDTVIGAWLRAQPVALKLGRTLFVHGGISPDPIQAATTIDDLNRTMHDYWQRPADEAERSPALDAVLGDQGATQYRGYFATPKQNATSASTAEVQRGLAHFDVDRIVVGHTLVPRIQSLHGGRVWAVDVNDDEAMAEVLVLEHDRPRVVNTGVHREIGEIQTTTRAFNPLAPSDLRLLIDMVRAYRQLGQISQPY